MNKIIYIFIFLMSFSKIVNAKGGHHFGASFNLGLPYLTGYHAQYLHASGKISASLGYASTGLTLGEASIDLSKIELVGNWHPFGGAIHLGVGLSTVSLEANVQQLISGKSISSTVGFSGLSVTPLVGTMWGVVDGGLFFGFDVGYQIPFSTSTETTTNASAAIKRTATYKTLIQDAEDSAEKYGSTALPVITLFKIGYLF